MDVRKLVELFGGQTALAGLVGINQSAVAYWVKKGAIPSKWHGRILELAIDKGVRVEASDLVPRSSATWQQSSGDGYQSAGAEFDGGKLTPFMFYASAEGAVKIQLLVQDETMWASQRGMAEIFDVDVSTINHHLKSIYESGELDINATIGKFPIVQMEGERQVRREGIEFYSLDAIISVGYRVSSHKATRFRVWATTVLKEYLTKGFALDDDRLKQGKALFGKDYFDELLDRIREIRASERRFYQKITDLYAQCSVDYDPNSPITQRFYAHVQDKLHYAIHGHTSAELIDLRVDANKPNMGLTHWKNEGSGGKITKTDVLVGKNYLHQEEIEHLNRLVSMYLDTAENLARRQRVLTMEEWARRLDDFLRFNEYDVLADYGKVRREAAERHAVQEYEKFRIVQDRNYRSDFDKVVDEIRITKKLPKGDQEA